MGSQCVHKSLYSYRERWCSRTERNIATTLPHTLSRVSLLITSFKRTCYISNSTSSEFLWSWQHCGEWNVTMHYFRAALPHLHGRQKIIFKAFALLSNVDRAVKKSRLDYGENWWYKTGRRSVIWTTQSSCFASRRIYLA
jgi:hypothetical protein